MKSLLSALVAVASVVIVSGCTPASKSIYTEDSDPLDGITVPSNWQLISDYERYDEARGSAVITKVRLPSVDRCVEDITNHAKIDQNGNWIGQSSCFERLVTYQGNPAARKLLSETLLELVKRDEIKHSRAKDVHYTYFESVMFLTLLYAAEKPRLELTVAQAEKIEDWLLKRVSVRLVSLDPAKRPPCTAMTRKMYIDDCGSTRQRFTMMNLVAGLIAGDQETFDRGIDSLKYVHRFIDEKGVYKGMAVRGGLAALYHVDMSDYYSVYAEILATLGINYFDYIAPSGASIEDSMAFTFSIVEEGNTEPLMKYAKMNKGNKGFDASILKNGPYRTGDANRYKERSARFFAEKRNEQVKNQYLLQMSETPWDTRAIFIANDPLIHDKVQIVEPVAQLTIQPSMGDPLTLETFECGLTQLATEERTVLGWKVFDQIRFDLASNELTTAVVPISTKRVDGVLEQVEGEPVMDSVALAPGVNQLRIGGVPATVSYIKGGECRN